MPTTVIGGREIQVNDEGFLTDPTQWSADLATELAALIGQPLTEAHWTLIHFLREDHAVTGETATLRRISTQTGVPIKELFTLFPGKPEIGRASCREGV